MDKIIGNIVGLPSPRSDWNQTDEMKADFIRNKPKIPVVDDELNINSNNAISNKIVSEFKKAVEEQIAGYGQSNDEAHDDFDSRIKAIEPLLSDNGDIAILEQGIGRNFVVCHSVVSESISVYLEEVPTVGFTAALYFATPEVIPANYSQFPADVYFKGDSTDNGALVPEANTRYTIVFDFDGYMLNAYVSGVTTV